MPSASPSAPQTPVINQHHQHHPAHALLSRAHSPTTASALFKDKVQQKPLLLNPTRHDAPSDKRALRRHVRLRKKAYYLSKRRPRPLSAKEKRALGVHELGKEEVRYEIYEGLWRIWVGYMWEVLGIGAGSNSSSGSDKMVTAQSHGSLLTSADFHGARVEVVRCGCVSRVGLKGIVVRDTKFTFVIVTAEDEVKTVPKRDTVLRYEIPFPDEKGEIPEAGRAVGRRRLVFELHGNQFEVRPAERANKKFKWRPMDYL